MYQVRAYATSLTLLLFALPSAGFQAPPRGAFLSWYLPRYPHSIKTQSESTHLTSTWRLVYSFHTSHVAPPMSRTFTSESHRPAFSIRIENPEVKLLCSLDSWRYELDSFWA